MRLEPAGATGAILPDDDFLLKVASHVDLAFHVGVQALAGCLGVCSVPALPAIGAGLCRRRRLLAVHPVRQ
ncbi:MAG TPA: hypothetical protein VFA64_17225 [Hyphomicrobiaceae bacterium]|nr:hypothetical protein [Hyphomicrobiaceae bacterium]